MGVQFSSALPTEAIEIVRKEGLSFPVRASFYRSFNELNVLWF